MEYLINLHAIVEAEDRDEAEKLADRIVNADLPDEVVSSLRRFGYDDGFGNSDIDRVPEDLR